MHTASICLIVSVYRIISNILVTKLKSFIGGLISPNQSAYISNRNMLEGVLTANKLDDYVSRHNKSLFLFKVDFEKAFNLISQGYLMFVLKKVAFCTNWLKWIRACVCLNSFPILVNGSTMIDFASERGFF